MPAPSLHRLFHQVSVSKKYVRFALILLALLCLGLCFEWIRSIFREGDFRGYPIAGNQILNGTNLYGSSSNTWPPFFGVVCIPIAMLDNLQSEVIRFFWLGGALLSFFWVMKWIIRDVLGLQLSLKSGAGRVAVYDPLFFVPFLIILRFLLDNVANVQINIYILILCVWAIRSFTRKRYALAGALLAFTISIKVIPIFLLFYFIFKREWKVVGWTLLFTGLFTASTVLVWGWEQAVEYHRFWYEEIASNPPAANRKNQSLWGMAYRWLTPEYPRMEFTINLISLSIDTVKKLVILLVGAAALLPAWIMRKKRNDKNDLPSWLEYSLIFAAIPVLSPLSWKAYFIFLWPAYWMAFLFLFRMPNRLSSTALLLAKVVFFGSIVLNIGSTDGIIGKHYSDVAEMYSAVTMGSLLLMGLVVWIYAQFSQFDTSQIRLASVKKE